ncbi:Hmra1p [Maudiozyma barnettii]|uniref:HMRA1, silenced extra-copy of a1 at HML n=1 Tax=Maudiozyma barnettii TaxID=61262 RepID=A0A8H2ZIT0_9SACH|nr:HMRA1, silenced extra-copy of a1 at HML [Kazachstania barnettii]CAB4253359.1 HMRA1, silenced extra-copy of a1 at HML [Kazachstania barnettii]
MNIDIVQQRDFNYISKDILDSGLSLHEKKELLKRLYDNYNLLVVPKKRKRTTISKSTKEFLEKVFEKKQWITREERQIVAMECGITPLQVRIWVCCYLYTFTTHHYILLTISYIYIYIYIHYLFTIY